MSAKSTPTGMPRGPKSFFNTPMCQLRLLDCHLIKNKLLNKAKKLKAWCRNKKEYLQTSNFKKEYLQTPE